MNFNKIFIISLLVLCSQYLVAQQIDLSSIRFEGNKKTKTTYLKRFLNSKIGASIDTTKLRKDAQRLRRLNAFADVNYEIVETTSGKEVVFNCKEVHTLLPIFGFGVLPENEWVQLGALDVNAFGKGIETYAFYQYNRRSTVGFGIKIPHYRGSKFGFIINGLHWESEEPLYFENNTLQYLYKNNSLLLGVSYELNYNNKIEFGGSLFEEKYLKLSEPKDELPGPNDVALTKFLFKLNHRFDNIDYFFHYRNGISNFSSAQLVFSENTDKAFYIFDNDFRFYKRLSQKGNFVGRWIVGVAQNNFSPFAPFTVDGHINLRGIGNRITRASAITSLNLEYRHTIYDDKKIAVQTNLFVDQASWREPGKKWLVENQKFEETYRMTVGGGLRFIHQKIYNAVFRIDIGYEPINTKEVGAVIGIGQYF